jgi:hypothetical protein
MKMSILESLYESVQKRWRPEDVAAKIDEVLENKSREEKRHLAVLKTAAKRPSYMRDDFAAVSGMDGQLSVAAELTGIDAPAGVDVYGIMSFLQIFESKIAKKIGANDFKADRLDRAGRKAAGLAGMSRRRYNKLFRLAARMEDKQARVQRALDMREFAQMSKTRLGAKVTWDEFSSDTATACFVAYYMARCNRRSMFTNQSQDRPYDELSDALFQRLKNNPKTTNWWAVAKAYPVSAVLSQLNDDQKGQLLGMYYDAMRRLAHNLEEVWGRSNINRETMIVRKGNDSSTWNILAGAWNKARDSWFALLYDMRAERILDVQCPGKVLRLMAADVAYWHKSSGGDLDPNTEVWKEVPLPWQVLIHDEPCTKRMVVDICDRHGMDPHKGGWAGPLPQGKVHAMKPTPDLVHGVTVASPELAEMLRKAGVFSGKVLKSDVSDLAEAIDDVRTEHWESQPELAKGAKNIAAVVDNNSDRRNI